MFKEIVCSIYGLALMLVGGAVVFVYAGWWVLAGVLLMIWGNSIANSGNG